MGKSIQIRFIVSFSDSDSQKCISIIFKDIYINMIGKNYDILLHKTSI